MRFNCLSIGFKIHRKRKRGLIYFVYVSRGIAKHLTHYIRVKAHAFQREHPYLYSCVFL